MERYRLFKKQSAHWIDVLNQVIEVVLDIG